MKKMNPVVHFEMPYEDKDRLAEFYSAVFGWEMQILGEDMMNYVLATTTKQDVKAPNAFKGAINGGFFAKNPEWPAQYPSVVIAVDNIHESIDLINKHGGKVLGEPMDIPGTGAYVSFYDTEGNRVSILQPRPM
jgi:predicted enzyme related to lactoylglutathione lyase